MRFLLLFYGIRREILSREEADRFDATHRQMLSLFASSAGREHSLRDMVEMLATQHAYLECAFHALDESSGSLAREGEHGPQTLTPAQCRLGEGVVGKAAETGHTVARPVALTGTLFGETNTHGRPPYVLATPVTYRERRFGVLTVASARDFSARALSLSRQRHSSALR